MSFHIDWASLFDRSKFTIFGLFYFVFEAISQVQASGGLIFGGAFALPLCRAIICRDLYMKEFSEFYGI